MRKFLIKNINKIYKYFKLNNIKKKIQSKMAKNFEQINEQTNNRFDHLFIIYILT